MNLRRSHPTSRTPNEQGSAMIVVLGLIIVMGVIIVSNSRALNDLKRNLRLVEQKQLQKFGVLTTNMPNVTNITNSVIGTNQSAHE